MLKDGFTRVLRGELMTRLPLTHPQCPLRTTRSGPTLSVTAPRKAPSARTARARARGKTTRAAAAKVMAAAAMASARTRRARTAARETARLEVARTAGVSATTTEPAPSGSGRKRPHKPRRTTPLHCQRSIRAKAKVKARRAKEKERMARVYTASRASGTPMQEEEIH